MALAAAIEGGADKQLAVEQGELMAQEARAYINTQLCTGCGRQYQPVQPGD